MMRLAMKGLPEPLPYHCRLHCYNDRTLRRIVPEHPTPETSCQLNNFDLDTNMSTFICCFTLMFVLAASAQDVDECAQGTHDCQQLCTNTVESFTCDCKTGYVLNDDGKTCTGRCRNSVGSFPCDACNDRYTPSEDGKWCDAPSDTKELCPGKIFPIPCYHAKRCIQPEWWCDTIPDCASESAEDELNCPPGCTGNNTFQCDNGKCVPIDYVCDQLDNCGDGSDQVGCDKFKCTTGEVKCAYMGVIMCMDQSLRCNGRKYCDNGEDEQNCG